MSGKVLVEYVVLHNHGVTTGDFAPRARLSVRRVRGRFIGFADAPIAFNSCSAETPCTCVRPMTILNSEIGYDH